MTSPLKSETARINGAQSQGPLTPEGKAASSQNSLRHGLCSNQAVLPGEDKEEFERHRASYIKRFQPRDQPEQDLVETLVAARWRLNRLMSIEAQLLENAEEPKDILKALSLLTRYENQLNRTFDKALQHLQALQENRPTAKNSAVRNEPKPTSKSDQDLLLQIEKAMRAPVPTPNITQKHPNAAV